MAAYVIGAGTVSDPAGFGEYQQKVGEVIARYGGRFVAGGPAEAVEGEFRPDGVAIIEFPSMEQARAWYDAADYQDLKSLRQRSARSTLLFLDGFPGQ
jgi:uncharacterized protein (DUF1330 family)